MLNILHFSNYTISKEEVKDHIKTLYKINLNSYLTNKIVGPLLDSLSTTQLFHDF